MFRSAFKNPRRVIGSPLFPEYCGAELVRDVAGNDDPGAGAGVNGAFFGRGMITGRSDVASTEFRNGERVVVAHDDDDECAAGGGDGMRRVGGAAPAGRGGAAVGTGGWLKVGAGGALLLPGVGASCLSQGVLELPDGMSGCAVDSGEDARMWTLRAAGAVAGVFVVVCEGVGCETLAGVGAGNSV